MSNFGEFFPLGKEVMTLGSSLTDSSRDCCVLTGMPWTQGPFGITLLECKSVFANREGKVWDLYIVICWAGLVDEVRQGLVVSISVIFLFLLLFTLFFGI